MLPIKQEKRPFYRMTFLLILPIMLQNLISVSLAFFDTFMVGLLGEAEMAAVTLANTPIFVIQLLIFGFQSGSSVLISQFWGKKDLDSINRVTGIAMYIAGALTMAFALLLLFAPSQVMGLLTNNSLLADIAAQYGRIVGISYFFNTLTSIYIGAQRSMENPNLGLIIFSISMVLNTVLNWVFIFGNLGAPKLGVEGAALATLITRIVEFGLTALYAVKNKRFPLKAAFLFCPGKPLLRSFLRYSTPVVLDETIWGLGTSLYPVIMGHMMGSKEILAAFTICTNVEKIFTVMSFSVAAAAAVIVGKEIGAGGSHDDVFQKGRTLTRMAFLFGLLMGALMLGSTYLLLIPYLYPMFRLSEQSAGIATMMLCMRSCLLPMIYYCTTNIVGVLRGGGDVKMAIAIDLGPLWLAALPMAALSGIVFEMDIFWVFLCMFLDQPIKMIFGLVRFHSKRWIKDLTQVSLPDLSCSANESG